MPCYLALELVRRDHTVMILDFESHEREWGSRLRGMGITDVEMDRTLYLSPSGRGRPSGERCGRFNS
jgi:hypothetical protein